MQGTVGVVEKEGRKEGGIGGRDNACENSQGEKGERQEAHGIFKKLRETCVCVLLTVVGRVMYIYIYTLREGERERERERRR